MNQCGIGSWSATFCAGKTRRTTRIGRRAGGRSGNAGSTVIRKIRGPVHLTIAEYAESCGVSARTLQDIERQESSPTPYNGQTAAQAHNPCVKKQKAQPWWLGFLLDDTGAGCRFRTGHLMITNHRILIFMSVEWR